MLYGLIIIISSLIYSIINAFISGLILPFVTGLNRRTYYFKECLWFSLIAVFFTLSFQVIFLTWHCRIEILFYKFFSLPIRACSTLDVDSFLMHNSLSLMLIFYMSVVAIQYYLTTERYELSFDEIIMPLVTSNAIACIIKYAFILFLV